MENSHKKQILNFLRNTGEGLSSWEAIQHFRCTRLAARIADLKDDGFRIETTMEKNETVSYTHLTLPTILLV